MILEAELLGAIMPLSALSGLGSFLQGRRDGRLSGGWLDCLTEIVLAVIVGLAIGYAGNEMKFSPALTCLLVLVLSNNGAEFLNAVRGVLMKVITDNLKRFTK